MAEKSFKYVILGGGVSAVPNGAAGHYLLRPLPSSVVGFRFVSCVFFPLLSLIPCVFLPGVWLASTGSGRCLAINSTDMIPKSNVNREFFAEEHDRKARAGIDYESSNGKARPTNTILKLQRTAGGSGKVGDTLNVAKPKKGSTVAVFGLGAVGFAAVEGARMAGASRIIGVDLNSSRFEEAKRFGITKFVNPKDHEKPVQEEVVHLEKGCGPFDPAIGLTSAVGFASYSRAYPLSPHNSQLLSTLSSSSSQVRGS